MPKGFPALVRKQAKLRGLRVRCQKTAEGGVVIQAYKEGEDAEQTAEGADVKAAKGKGKK